jgi:acetoacetate decarboxylase
MGVRGTLTRDKIGFSMPAHAPLFPAPPYLYQGATLLVFEYVTDPGSAAGLLPAQAELLDPPVAGMVFADYPSSTLGPYREFVQFLACIYQGQPVQFATHLYVTSDVAMACGREMGGYPKKGAEIRFDAGPPVQANLARSSGLASATMTASGDPKPVAETLHYLTLRLIPSPTRDAAPTVAELLLTDWEVLNAQQWQGTGSCSITGNSPADPIHLVPVVKPLDFKLIRGDLRVAANDPAQTRSQPF